MRKPKIAPSTLSKVLKLMNDRQARVFSDALKGEDAEFFARKAKELERILDTMFTDRQIDGCGDNATVNLHYFAAGSHWWLQAKDQDRPDVYFGYARLAAMPECAEYGYVDLIELKEAGVELDLHWQRVPLRVALERFNQ